METYAAVVGHLEKHAPGALATTKTILGEAAMSGAWSARGGRLERLVHVVERELEHLFVRHGRTSGEEALVLLVTEGFTCGDHRVFEVGIA